MKKFENFVKDIPEDTYDMLNHMLGCDKAMEDFRLVYEAIKKDELDTRRKESAKKKRKYETAMKQKDFNETLKIISQLKKEIKYANRMLLAW